jgi:hypothetical protein
MDPLNRRRHPRFEGQFKVDLLNMGDDPDISAFEPVVPATALDVSRQGLRLKCHYQAKVGSLLSAIVYYKSQGSVCLCEVVWKREERGNFIYGLFIQEWSQLEPGLDRELQRMEESKSDEQLDIPPSAPAVAKIAIA